MEKVNTKEKKERNTNEEKREDFEDSLIENAVLEKVEEEAFDADDDDDLRT